MSIFHTPGPWLVYSNIHGQIRIKTQSAEKVVIAECMTNDRDAYLIAAAPCVTIALIELLRDPTSAPKQADARLALAKARGE